MTGVQRHAFEIISILNRSSYAKEFEIVVPKASASLCRHSQNIEITQYGNCSGHAWEQVELLWYSRGRKLVNLCNTFPVLHPRQVITVHDAAIYTSPQSYSLAFRSAYKLMHGSIRFNKGLHCLTDSQFSARELSKYTLTPLDRWHVVPCGGDHMQAVVPDDSVLSRFGLWGRRYLLAVGSRNLNKNIPALLAAYQQIAAGQDVPLLLVGGGNGRIFEDFQLPTTANVHETGYITDQQLAALYRHAHVFVFPSLYEGFGLPVLEAMSLGCPTLISREASLPEVGGDASLYCDAHSVDDIAAQLRRVLSDDFDRAWWSERAHHHAATFTWARTARRVLSAVEQLPDART